MWKFQQNRDDSNNAHVRIIVPHFESVWGEYIWAWAIA